MRERLVDDSQMSTAHQLLSTLGVPAAAYTGGSLRARSPIDGSTIGMVHANTPADVGIAAGRAQAAFLTWRNLPAPRRGELVRLFGAQLRQHKATLAALVTLEAGKVSSEGEGEVQEMIDICDFAVGLSRQLHGLTIASERPGHRMMEQWHPLGVVGVISAFNFPVAVWSWNAALALVCGNSVLWKPSEKAPLTALATQALFDAALALSGGDPALAAAKSFPGNRPSATLLLDRLDAATLGALLAFYEHRTFTAATLLGINPFDQWGVELGKDMAGQIETGGSFDASTAALMARAGL